MDTKADIDYSRKKYAPHWRTEVGWHNIPEFLPGFGVPLPCGDADLPVWRQYTFAYLNHGIPEYDVIEVGIMEHTGYRAMLRRGGDPCEDMPGDFSVNVSLPAGKWFVRWFLQHDDAREFAGEWMRAHRKGMTPTERDRDRYGQW